MPTILSSISNTAITVRWKEPYASDALNRKLSAIIPAGVYRGLRLEVSASNLSVDIAEDSTHSDHVAVFDTDDGHSITYRDRSSGRITFDLSSFLSGEAVTIAASTGYTIGADTAAEFLGYTQVEFDALNAAQRSSIVVLGMVLRPASGIIPVANISHDERDISFINRASESVPWNPLIRNSGFEISDTNETFRHASPFWETFNVATTGGAVFLSLATDVDSNSGSKSLEVSASVVGGVISTARQALYTPVIPGRSIRVSLHKKAIQAATGTNSGVIRLSFEDKDGSSDTDVDLSFDVDSIDGSFVELSGVVTVPASMAVLKMVEVIVTGTYAGTGACIRIDDVQVWYEVDAKEWLAMNSSLSSEVDTDALIIGNRPLGIDAAKLSFDGTNLVIESRDPSSSATGIISDALQLGNNLLSTVADAGIARVVAPASVFAGVEYTLMWESVPTGAEGLRKYVDPNGTLVEVINASYDNTTNSWTKDVAASRATRFDLGSSGTSYKYREGTTVSWADSDWEIGGGTDHFGQPDQSKWKAWTHIWLQDPGDASQPWVENNTNLTGANLTRLIAAGGEGFNNPGIIELSPSSDNGNAYIASFDTLYALRDDSVMIYELPVHLVHTDSLIFAMGWSTRSTLWPPLVGLPEHAFLKYDPIVSPNWIIMIAGPGGSTDFVTSVAVTQPKNLLRLELIGANHPEGEAVRGYVNGQFVGEVAVAGHIPTARMKFGAASESGALNASNADYAYLGSPTLKWNVLR